MKKTASGIVVCSMKAVDDIVVLNERSRRHDCVQRKKQMTMLCSMNKPASGVVVCSMKEIDDMVVCSMIKEDCTEYQTMTL